MMSSTFLSVFNFRQNAPTSIGTQLNQKIRLKLQYIDKKCGVALKVGVITPSMRITIHDLIKDLLNFAHVDDIAPEHIRLYKIMLGNEFYGYNQIDPQTKLYELDVQDDCILHFIPSRDAPPLKPSQLTIWGPDNIDKFEYQWFKAVTTLAMLFNYIVDKFSLQSIERERIHLITSVDELNTHSHLNKRLSEMDVFDRMSIYVQIISPDLPISRIENPDVHVECNYDGNKFTLDISTVETIDELKNRIKKELNDRFLFDLKLYNELQEEIHLIDSDRTLKSFGIKADQTIVARFSLTDRPAPSSIENKQKKLHENCSNQERQEDEVTVVCRFSMLDQETLFVSEKITVEQIIQKAIDQRKKHQLLILSEIKSTKNVIDIKEVHRSLADLGIKPGEIIYITMTEKRATHSSIVQNPSSTTRKFAKISSTYFRPVGLDNLGNTCYMNSAFQCLAHIQPLTHFFFDGIRRAQRNGDKDTQYDYNPFEQVGELTSAYADLLWSLWRCGDDNDESDSLKPTFIKDIIARKDSHFSNAEQQDAQEFMTFLLDAMHREMKNNQNDRNTIIKSLFFGQIKSTIKCTECNHEESTINPISFLSIPLNRLERTFWINFIGKNGKDQTHSVEVSIDGRVEHLVKNFTVLLDDRKLFYYILVMTSERELDFKTALSEIPDDELLFIEQDTMTNNTSIESLKRDVKISTLEECLEQFLSPEQLEDQWSCQQETCRKKSLAIKQLELHILPPVLIIQFKRFAHENGFRQKVETFVEYPLEQLNLNKFLRNSSSQETIYDLVAVCNHMGSINGGHYTAFARRITDNQHEWYQFDDSCVTRVSSSYYDIDLISRYAYLLFYIKKDFLKKHLRTTNLEM